MSPFSAYHSQSVEEICQTVKSLCAEEGQRFIYAYWHQPDYDIHDYGTAHPQIRADIEYINGEVEGLCHGVSDTLVIVTADHGLVDTTWVYLEDYPDVMECLAQKPSIESRALSFFIKPGMNDFFEDVFRKHFGEIYRLLPKEQVLRENWFGAGTPHPHVKAFIGDYLAVAFSHTSIETGSRNQANTFKGAHAGCTAEEMNIPFIAVSCGK